jgi:hypothetical protein
MVMVAGLGRFASIASAWMDGRLGLAARQV